MSGSHIDEEYDCQHPGCKAWGGFGFGRQPTRTAHWYCWEHGPKNEVASPNVSPPGVRGAIEIAIVGLLVIAAVFSLGQTPL